MENVLSDGIEKTYHAAVTPQTAQERVREKQIAKAKE